MNSNFQPTAIRWALLLAFSTCQQAVLAAEPFPALPPALSTSVTPNIMLYIDTSGSMLQDQNNQWMLTNICNSNSNWSSCVNDNDYYRASIDSEKISPNTKMNIAKRVARNLVLNNRGLRFGLFTFQDNVNDIGQKERSQAGKLRQEIINVSADASPVINAINGIYGRTATPLAEGLLEITRYFEGKSSLYKVYSGNYTSPIQYRCQKNFVILITDGDATDDQNLPGTGQKGDDGNAVITPNPYTYTARDSDGNAVSPAPSFSVCTAATSTADNGYNVTCPSKYDGTSVDRDFGAASNRPSALRDVAMYANRADLRIGGTDGDGKSFDDPKFAKQSLVTYTVGFSVANSVLPATALVGGGKYYKATDEASLTASLVDAVSSINASLTNAGGLAVTPSTSSASGKLLFQPVFKADGWYGELRCYNLTQMTFDSSGNVLTGACSPSKAVIPSESTRRIYSMKWQAPASAASGAGAFEIVTTSDATRTATLNNMTTAQKNTLGSTDADRKNVLQFLHGVEGISGLRTRTVDLVSNKTILLGDIIDGQPAVVAAPTGSTSDTTYSAFKTSNSARNMVFIGANDGMLHAFDIGNSLSEIMGFIPSAVYPHLDDLTKMDYGNGTPHVYHVNGALRQADVKLGGTWKTILVGGLAQGGQGYFALDTTDTATLKKSAADAIKWEWTDQHDNEMGYSFGAPVIYNVRSSSSEVVPAVVLVNGYENSYDDTAVGGALKSGLSSNTSALYIVRADTGALLTKIPVPGGSGLSSPAGVDFGQDGILDYLYVGDMSGKLWRFDLTGSDPSKFRVSTNPIFDAGSGHPITIRPAVKGVSSENKSLLSKGKGNLVFFGTGKLLTDTDRSDETTQSFYAVLDDIESEPVTVLKGELLARTISDTATESRSGYRAGTYRKISNSPTLDLTSATNTYKGWYLDLPEKTERLVSSPQLLDYIVYFGTGIPKATDSCVIGGTGWLMGLDPMTGALPKTTAGGDWSFVDLNKDGKSNDSDKVAFGSGSALAAGYATAGIPAELTIVSTNNNFSTISPVGSGTLNDIGSVIALQNSNVSAVFTGNGASGTTTGNPMNKPSEDNGVNTTCVGGRPGVGVDCNKEPLRSSAYKVETLIWREIK